MLKNKCCLYVIISIRFFSITICNLLIKFPSYISWWINKISILCVLITLSRKVTYFTNSLVIRPSKIVFLPRKNQLINVLYEEESFLKILHFIGYLSSSMPVLATEGSPALCSETPSVTILCLIYIHGSVRRKSALVRSNKMQLYAGMYLLQNHSPCFGCPSHPSSGVH